MLMLIIHLILLQIHFYQQFKLGRELQTLSMTNRRTWNHLTTQGKKMDYIFNGWIDVRQVIQGHQKNNQQSCVRQRNAYIYLFLLTFFLPGLQKEYRKVTSLGSKIPQILLQPRTTNITKILLYCLIICPFALFLRQGLGIYVSD